MFKILNSSLGEILKFFIDEIEVEKHDDSEENDYHFLSGVVNEDYFIN